MLYCASGMSDVTVTCVTFAKARAAADKIDPDDRGSGPMKLAAMRDIATA